LLEPSSKQSEMVGPNTLVYCCVTKMGMERVSAIEVKYLAVDMIVSELYMRGRKRSWMSQRKKEVVPGFSFPIAVLAVRAMT